MATCSQRRGSVTFLCTAGLWGARGFPLFARTHVTVTDQSNTRLACFWYSAKHLPIKGSDLTDSVFCNKQVTKKKKGNSLWRSSGHWHMANLNWIHNDFCRQSPMPNLRFLGTVSAKNMRAVVRSNRPEHVQGHLHCNYPQTRDLELATPLWLRRTFLKKALLQQAVLRLVSVALRFEHGGLQPAHCTCNNCAAHISGSTVFLIFLGLPHDFIFPSFLLTCTDPDGIRYEHYV